MSSTSGKKSRHLIRKIISLFLLITICLFLLFILFLRFFLPQNQIKLYTEKSLSQALERPVYIQELKINPFGSVNISNISICQQSVQEDQMDTLIQIKRIVLKYKFFSLFRRRLWITEALIDSPEFHFPSGTEISGSEDKKIQKEKQQKQRSVSEEKSADPLPFTFLMSRFELKDCVISLVLNNTDNTSLELEDLHLDISRVNLPRDFQQSRERIRGSIKLYTEEGTLRIRSKDFNDQYRTNIVITAVYQTSNRWNMIASIKVGKKGWEKDIWPSLSVDIEGRNFAEILSINKASLHTEKLNLFNLSGSVINLKKFDLTLNSSRIDIESTLHSYAGLFSDLGLNFPDRLQINGFLDPVNGSINGTSDSLQVNVDSRLNLEKFLMTSDSTLINKGFLHLEAGGWADLTKIKEISVSGEFGFDSFRKSMNDSVSINTGALSGTLTTQLDSLIFPVNGNFYCSLNDLIKGKAEMDVHWSTDNKIQKKTERVILNAGLRADSLELSLLPFPLPDIKGRAGLDLNLSSRGGMENRMQLSCVFDSVRYNQEMIGGEKHILYAHAFIRADSALSVMVLDTCEFSFDKVLDWSIQGSYNNRNRSVDLVLDQAIIDNAEIAAYLPRSLSENLKLSGHENLRATFQGRSYPDTFSASFTASMRFVNTGLSLLKQQIFVNSLKGGVDLKGNMRNIAGEGSVVINTVEIPELRSSSLENSSFDFKGTIDALNTYSVSKADISLPSLGFRGSIKGSLKNLSQESGTRIKGDAFFELDCPDTVRMIHNILVKGKVSASLQAETYDSVHTKVHIAGKLNSDTLEINSIDKFRIMNIKSSFPFRIDYDLDKNLLVNLPADSLHFKKDYTAKRSLYQNLFPEIGKITLDSVEISAYKIDRINTDILCRGNNIQLPWLDICLFGGNIAGDLYLNLNTGKLNSITYTLTGNANRINSAMISRVKQKKKKKSELDATFRFQGRGIDISEMIDVSGYFHIINLGSDFASNLLSSIDPSGSDRSIKMTKQLINTGWKPGIFSFELRHGYVYPSFNLHQPWFSPVRLPERLEYGRLPLSFFLKSK